MAHPLNRPRIDAALGRVVEGYGVLQPRVTPSLPVGTEGSLFQRIFSSNSGIDPYAAAVSDVYQDLYGEGSYSGKGIYDIDAFETRPERPRPRQHDAEPRSVRGHLRARGAGVGHRGRRGVPRALRRGGGAPAPLGARRLAAPAVDAGTGAGGSDARPGGLPHRHRLLEDVRQPAPHAVGARRAARPSRGMAPALPRRPGLDDFPGADRRHADDPARHRLPAAAARRDHPAQSLRRAVVGRRRGERPGGAARRLSRPSRLADGRCDRPDPVPPSRPSPPAGMDHRRPVQAPPPRRLARSLRHDGRQPRRRRAGRHLRGDCRYGRAADRGAVRAGVAGGALGRPVGEPPAARCRKPAHRAGR